MKVLPLILALLMTACASPSFTGSRPEQDLFHKTVSTCTKMTDYYREHPKQPSCQIWDMSRIHLSFQSKESYDQVAPAIATLIQGWCSSAAALRPGTRIYYSWDYSLEKATFSRRCPGDRK